MSTETAHKDQKERDISSERGYLVLGCVCFMSSRDFSLGCVI